MQSKNVKSKLNPLFMDTRVFNMSSAMYMPELSKPVGIEALEKDGSSPFKT